MTNYRNKTVCCVDNGLFVEFGVLLSKYFGKVLYYSPWESAFPKSNALMIGEGLEGVTRIKEFWSVLDDIDLFLFPDVYHGALQAYLVEQGKRVWGCRIGEQIELDRAGAKELLKELGIDVGPYAVIKGLDALEEYLKEHDKQYVKVSMTRGDMETFYARDWKLIEPRIRELGHSLGPIGNHMQFVVEEAIDPAVEAGYDGYCIDGKFPKGAMSGIEVKDKGYVLRVGTYDDLPEEVRSVNDKLKPFFEAMQYRSFWSSEIRITPDHTPYLIDPCPRAGSPPSELYQLMISNWPDILWEGAGGTLVEPNFKAQFGAELLIISEWAESNWQAIDFPDEIRDNVKLRNCCMIDGRYYAAPQWVGCPEIGAVVAMGDTQQEAIDNCKAIAEKVEGHYISTYADSLEEACEEIDKLTEMGIEV